MINKQIFILHLVFCTLLRTAFTISENEDQHKNGSCLVPNNPHSGTYTVGSNPTGTVREGVYVPPLTPLILNCQKRYKPVPPGNFLSICHNGEWLPSPAACSPACPPVESTDTTIVNCKFLGKTLDSCKDPIDGVQAVIKCAEFYEEPGVEQFPYRRCIDGSWDRTFPQCLPVCGLKRPRGIPDPVDSNLVRRGDFPWHVGIYDAKTKSNICGGTLISLRAVVSAAYCFSNLSNGRMYPKENYLVATGKYFLEYHDNRDEDVKYSGVNDIFFPMEYKGEISQYESDIAVVILNTALTPTTSVQPICVDWASKFEYQQISGNNSGLVVGSDLTESIDSSKEFKELAISVLPFEQCFEQVPKDFQRFLTHDKICSELSSSGQSIREGYGGGGLVQYINNRYYLRGIVSVASKISQEGSNVYYVTYTLMSKYVDFVKQLL
ncbi:hypothetical protein ILUMI_12995 [Ignelater luminosus]|uniref:Peptidase S1 domain-containing protein n=1 Tax=Ignelater luminosus TaxID=2038154 RepID=A0A8K0CVC4_IGNLU|nr:hypothetical protein ILUMI_12995 [Ignelater luminosus]